MLERKSGGEEAGQATPSDRESDVRGLGWTAQRGEDENSMINAKARVSCDTDMIIYSDYTTSQPLFLLSSFCLATLVV